MDLLFLKHKGRSFSIINLTHMETNERFIKLSSRLPFDKDIQLGTDITFLIEGKQFIGNCVKIEYEDQQDGTQNVIYKLKFVAE
jgi:hypothetical protein